MSYVGWEIHSLDRTRLLARFAPAYSEVIADHVTEQEGDSPLPESVEAEVVGIADDGHGVQALVVAIDGEIVRPDGHVYHATWSVDRALGRMPAHANDVLDVDGWVAVDPPIPIRVAPMAA